MYSENAGLGHHTFQQPHNYCHLCAHNGPTLPSGPGRAEESCLQMESDLTQLGWSRHLRFLPQERGSAQGHERTGRVHHTPQRQQIYTRPKHYGVPEDYVPSSSWEWNLSRWNRQPDPHLRVCTCMRERPGECGCVRQWYYYKPHPFDGNHMPLPNAEFRGHHYYRETCYEGEEHYWSYMSEYHHQRNGHLHITAEDNQDICEYNGHCEQRHVSFQSNDEHSHNHTDANRQQSGTRVHCNGPNTSHKAFFSTEVPQSKFRSSRGPEPSQVNVNQQEELGPGQPRRRESDGGPKNQRKHQDTVKEQIKQVVTELEEVLGGLKQVHLEMREVVQQIDILTSDIDLGEEEGFGTSFSRDTRKYSGGHDGAAALNQNVNEDQELPQWISHRPSVQNQTNHSPSLNNPSSVETSHATCYPLTYPSSPLHETLVPETKVRQATVQGIAVDSQWDRPTANRECVQSRPPRVKVKEVQHQMGRGDLYIPLKSPDPPFPLDLTAIPTKNHRPPPCHQNGQVQMLKKGSEHSPRSPRMSPSPEKPWTLSSTVV